jgi:hypothetical protein
MLCSAKPVAEQRSSLQAVRQLTAAKLLRHLASPRVNLLPIGSSWFRRWVTLSKARAHMHVQTHRACRDPEPPSPGQVRESPRARAAAAVLARRPTGHDVALPLLPRSSATTIHVAYAPKSFILSNLSI